MVDALTVKATLHGNALASSEFLHVIAIYHDRSSSPTMKLARQSSLQAFFVGNIMRQFEIFTPIGSMVSQWSSTGLFSCQFMPPNSPPVDRAPEIDVPGKRLQAAFDEYFETGVFAWPSDDFDWSKQPPFHKEVLQRCRDIPAGETCTYGHLAQLAGSPHAARAVGVAMAKNRWPIIIPCHRVVGANGNLVGYSGRGGLTTKRKLLQFEAELGFAQLPLFSGQNI